MPPQYAHTSLQGRQRCSRFVAPPQTPANSRCENVRSLTMAAPSCPQTTYFRGLTGRALPQRNLADAQTGRSLRRLPLRSGLQNGSRKHRPGGKALLRASSAPSTSNSPVHRPTCVFQAHSMLQRHQQWSFSLSQGKAIACMKSYFAASEVFAFESRFEPCRDSTLRAFAIQVCTPIRGRIQRCKAMYAAKTSKIHAQSGIFSLQSPANGIYNYYVI